MEAGEFDRAEQLLNEASAKDLAAAERQESVAKQRRLSAARSKANNGDLKWTQFAYREAAEYYRQAAALVPAEALVQRAEYLNLQGRALYEAGDYRDAEEPLTQALALREQALGPEHPDVATSLNNLAVLYHAQGQYAKAEPLYQRALAIREKALGPEHPDVATSLNNLAGLYHAQGQYAKAEPLYRARTRHPGEGPRPRASRRGREPQQPGRALSRPRPVRQGRAALPARAGIREKALGPEHPDVATSLNNLAVLYRRPGPVRQGRAALPARARDLGEGARPRASRRGHEPQQPGRALSRPRPVRQGRAALSARARHPGEGPRPRASRRGHKPQQPGRALRRPRPATPRPSRSTSARSPSGRRPSGPSIPTWPPSLNNLAGLYHAQGQYAKAEPLYQRALAILEKALGPEHPDVATSLNNLAGSTTPKASTRRPSRSIERALAIKEKALGPEHPDVATSLNNLAGLYRDQGQYAKAEPLYQRALAIAEKALGPEHPNVATIPKELRRIAPRGGPGGRGRRPRGADCLDGGQAALRSAVVSRHPLSGRSRRRAAPEAPLVAIRWVLPIADRISVSEHRRVLYWIAHPLAPSRGEVE